MQNSTAGISSATKDSKPNPCKCGSQGSVVVLKTNRHEKSMGFAECVLCQRATPILPISEVIGQWNKEFGC